MKSIILALIGTANFAMALKTDSTMQILEISRENDKGPQVSGSIAKSSAPVDKSTRESREAALRAEAAREHDLLV